MSRRAGALDRLVVLLLGLALLAGGAALIGWRTGQPASLWDGVGTRLSTGGLASVADQGWWPWACAAAGLVLVLLGLRWLAAHLPQRPVRQVALPGTDSTGRLRADLGPVASMVADELGALPGVRSSSGRVLDDRGRRTLDLSLVLDPHARPAEVRHGVDVATGHLVTALGDACAVRVRLRVSRRGR